MATIIRLLVKGSELLNRLRQQQAGNRAGQAQRERDRQLQDKAKKDKQQQQAPVFAPEAKRRRIEPIAGRRKSDWYFVVVNTYNKRAPYFWPNGASAFYSEPYRLDQGLPSLPEGEFIEQEMPPVIGPIPDGETYRPGEVFDGRVPINNNKFQRLYKPWLAPHVNSSTMTLGVSYYKLSGPLTEAGEQVTSLTQQEIFPIKTISPVQALPYTYYPRLKKAQGFAIGFGSSGIALQVRVETSTDKRTELMFGVGDEVRIFPTPKPLRSSGITPVEVDAFYKSYWYSDPSRVYTITEVDQSTPGQTRYFISNANWPAITLSSMDYYVVKRHDSWNTVGAGEFVWAYDYPGVTAEFALDKKWSNLTSFGPEWTFSSGGSANETGELKVELYTEAVQYNASRTALSTYSGLPLITRSSQDFTDAYNAPGAVEYRTLSFKAGQSSVALTDGVDSNDLWAERYHTFDSVANTYTFFFQQRFSDPNAPDGFPLCPVTVSKDLIRSIIRSDLGDLGAYDYGNVSAQPDFHSVFLMPGS